MKATQISFSENDKHIGSLIEAELTKEVAEELFIYKPLVTANKKRVMAGELFECISDALVQIQRIPFVYMRDKLSTDIYNRIIVFLNRLLKHIRVNPTAIIFTQFISI